MSLLLHGIVRAGHPSAPRVVTWRDLAVVVGDGHAPTERAHLAALTELVLAGPVVPLAFGTTAVDEDSVRAEVLAPAAARLRADLDRLDGVVEFHAYLRFNEDEAMQAAAEEHRSERHGEGDLSARVRLDERLVAWRRARGDALLSPIAAAARAETRLPDRDHAEERRAFLLPHKEVEPARAAIGALRILAGVETECVGPLPAFNFLTEPAGTSPSRSCW